MDRAGRIATFEGLRGVAALAVVFTHLGGAWGRAFSHAYLAVDLFFLMSGVVIAQAYGKRLGRDLDVRAFLAARVRRLAPLYLLGALLGAGCAFVAHRSGYGGDGSLALNAALAATFVPALLGRGDLYPLNAPSWSLLDELLANFAYGLVARSLSRWMLAALAGCGLVLVILVAVRSGAGLNVGVAADGWTGGIGRVTFGFFLGVLLQELHADGRLPVMRIPAGLAVAVVAATFLWPGASPAYDLLVVGCVYPLVVVAALANPPRHPLAMRGFLWAGALSYPLYVLHYPPLHLLRAVTDDGVGLRLGLVVTAAALLVAQAAHHGFDAPLRRWWTRRAERGAPPPLASQA